MDQMSIVTPSSGRHQVQPPSLRRNESVPTVYLLAGTALGLARVAGPDDDRQIYPYCGLELASERALMCTDALRVMRRLAVRFAAVTPHRDPAPG